MSETSRENLEKIFEEAKKSKTITKQAILSKLDLNYPPLASLVSNLAARYNFDLDFVLAIVSQESGLLTSQELKSRRGIDVGFFQLNYHPENPAALGPVQQWQESNRSPLPDPFSATGNAEIAIWYLDWVRAYVRNLSSPPTRNSTEELAVTAAAYHGLWTLKNFDGNLGLYSLTGDYYWRSVMNFFNRFKGQSSNLEFASSPITSGRQPISSRYSSTLLEAINSNELVDLLPDDSAIPESNYTPLEFPSGVADLDDGYLRINDIEFDDIPPNQISVTQESMHKQSAALRASSNAFLRTGQTRLNIQIVLDFVDVDAPGKEYVSATEYINQKLLPLIAQFTLTPFCQVANRHIASQIFNLAGIGSDKTLQTQSTIALALTDMVISTHPESPGGMKAALNFIYFNYQPFSTNFSYLEDFTKETLDAQNGAYNPANEKLFISPPKATLSKAFRKFYEPKLSTLKPLPRFPNSNFQLRFETNPIGSKNPFVPRISDKNPPELEEQITEANKLKSNLEVVDLDHPRSVLDASGGLKIMNISISLSNHLSMIPLLSWELPTIQFLGARDFSVNIDFQSIGKGGAHQALAQLRRFHAITDRKAISNKTTRKLAIEAFNDILGLFNITHVIIDNLETHTTQSPELIVGRLSLGVTRPTVANDHLGNKVFDYISTNQNKHAFYKELLRKLIGHYGLYYFLYPNQNTPNLRNVTTDPYGHAIVQTEAIPKQIKGEITVGEETQVSDEARQIINLLEEIFEDNLNDFILDDDPFKLAESLLSNDLLKQLRSELIESAFANDNPEFGELRKVVEVIDGDTVLLDDGTKVSLRLLSVNTPEIAHPGNPDARDEFGGTEFKAGNEAKKLVEDLLLNKMVRAQKKSIDPYGRKLTYLYLPDGTSVSGLLSALGYGAGRRIYKNEGVNHLNRFLDMNYGTIFSLLEDDERKSLLDIAKNVGRLQNINYPDFYLATNSSGESHIEGVSAQDLNPDFYFYNKADDPATTRRTIKNVSEEASALIQQQYGLYSNFLFEESTRNRKELLADQSDRDIIDAPIATNEPRPEEDENGNLIKYDPQVKLSHQFDVTALSTLLKETISSYQPQQYKMRRAYPTFQVFFLEEDDVQFGWRSYNDFYTSDTIEFIMITRSREIPADTAYIRLNNFTGELTKKKFSKVNPETLSENMLTQQAPLVDTINENPAGDLIFKEGTRVQVRLGYDNDPNKLPIIFNGVISSMSGTDSIEIYCQSFAIELVNSAINIESSGIIELGRGVSILNTNSNYNTRLMFQKLLRRPEIVHFGKWVTENGIDIWAPIRASISGLGYNYEIRPDGRLVPKWHYLDTPVDDNIYIPDFGDANDSPFSKAGETIERVILPAFLENIAHNYADSVFGIPWLWTYPFYIKPGANIWDIAQEVTLRYPGYISSAVPFDDRMTYFFGHPSQNYCWRDPSLYEKLKLKDPKLQTEIQNEIAQASKLINSEGSFNYQSEKFSPRISEFFNQKILPSIFSENGRSRNKKEVFNQLLEDYQKDLTTNSIFPKESVKPFRNFHFVTSYHDIISNEIRADFNGTITVAHVGWSAALKDDPRNTTTIKLDDSIPDPDSFEADAFPGAYRDALFNEINVHTEEEAARYGVSYLCKSLKDLYKGEIVLIGNPEIKPYDIIFIFDDYNDMAGPVEVKQVVHSFSPEYGFTTTVTPDCLVEPGDAFNFSYMKAASHAWTTLYKETNEALTQTGWSPTLSGVITGLGGITGVMKVNHRQPIIITPLIRNGVPWINGISAFQKGNYWLEWGGKINRYFEAFGDGVDYFKENLYEKVGEDVRTFRETKIDWEFQ